MDTMSAGMMGMANRGNPMMVFDWIKAAKMIKEAKPNVASAGLSSDWEWTGGTIYTADGIPEDHYTYLASTWATPEINLDGDIHDCFIMEDERPDWDSDTWWPQEAIDILGEQVRGTVIDAEFEEIAGEIEA
jgi:hypothetical protein